MKTAFAARRLRATPEGLQVLGLRAAATAPLGTVAGVLRSVGTTGGVGAETLEALGRAELRRLGLRLHAVPVGLVWLRAAVSGRAGSSTEALVPPADHNVNLPVLVRVERSGCRRGMPRHGGTATGSGHEP